MMTFKDADPNELEAEFERLFAMPEFDDAADDVKQQFRMLVEELPEDLDAMTQDEMDNLLAEPRYALLKAYLDQPDAAQVVDNPSSSKVTVRQTFVPQIQPDRYSWESQRDHPRGPRKGQR